MALFRRFRQFIGSLSAKKTARVRYNRFLRNLMVELLEERQVLSLVIVPTFDSTITTDPNAATIENTINTAIATYEACFSDPITVNITYEEGGGLGGSSKAIIPQTYAAYIAALASHATTADDTTALANLPTTANNPVTNDPNVFVTSALTRALGLPGGNVPTDGIITLNTSICNLTRTGAQNPANYDLLAVVCHEMDEVLGSGSALDGSNNGDPTPTDIEPLDLFRYSRARRKEL